MKGRHTALLFSKQTHTPGSHGASGAYEVAHYSLGYNFYYATSSKMDLFKGRECIIKN